MLRTISIKELIFLLFCNLIILEGGEPLPKTYLLINETWEYFKPKIQVEVDSHEKEIITEIFIRNFFDLKKFKYNSFKN